MRHGHISRGGFALPTVLIASVVMLMIMAVSVTSIVAVRTTLKTQYYEQLAKAAGEAGVAYAKACLAKNGNVPLWTNAKPLKPSTDCAGNPLLSPQIQVLVVAGGGGGGFNHGGGGGGGGVRYDSAFAVSPQTYPIVVGGGGAGANSTSAPGGTGGNSSFASISSLGGGGGGGRVNTNIVTQAGSGGSGGGGAGTLNGSVIAAGGTGTSGQGNNGGSGSSGATAGHGGGGGGGGAVGGSAVGTTSAEGVSGIGGIGYASDITGGMIYYGAGGSGGRWGSGSVGMPGITGGGRGGPEATAGLPGQANTGGGGGGGGGAASLGGAGGSGVVIVRYPNNNTITTNRDSNAIITGAYKVLRFTSSDASFQVTSAQTSTCPSDPRCSVLVSGNLRSSFSVGQPTLNAEGKALTIPNTGYVELLRESNNEVWRTYKQPSVQAAVVPDLCSGAATSSLGWANAVRAATQASIPSGASAETISLAAGNVDAGKMYFRKEFAVTQSGNYDLSLLTTSSQDKAEIYIDSTLLATSQGSLASGSIGLQPGCHIATVVLTNKTVFPRPSSFTASLQRSGSAPLVVSDSSWRVSSGSAVHFSESDFYADPEVWTQVQDVVDVQYRWTNSYAKDWQGPARDTFTRLISTNHSGCNLSCPNASYTFMRDSKDFILDSNREVVISALCDDQCSVYIDGNQVISTTQGMSNMTQQKLTLTAGSHRVALQLRNTGASANQAEAALTIVDNASGVVLTRTDSRWVAANSWFPTSSIGVEPTATEASFLPTPDDIPKPRTIDLLVVSGGGGGGNNSAGGGGGGGVKIFEDFPLWSNLTVYGYTVGAGGASSGSGSVRGVSGGASSFLTAQTTWGGGGASRDGGEVPGQGATGGGGAGQTTSAPVTRYLGALSYNSAEYEGAAGGNGTPPDPGAPAKGGGGGGAAGKGAAATTTLAGNGGAGVITYFTGSRMVLGGGGGGSNTAGNGFLGKGEEGASNGGATGVSGQPNTGGGAGGSTGSSASGGSGLIAVRFPVGMLTATPSGPHTIIPSVNIKGVDYTIYLLTGVGSYTFTITSMN